MERDGVKKEAEKEKVGGGQENGRRLPAPRTQEMVDGGEEKDGAGEEGNGVEKEEEEDGMGGKEEKERPVPPGAREEPKSLLPLPAATMTTTTNTNK